MKYIIEANLFGQFDGHKIKNIFCTITILCIELIFPFSGTNKLNAPTKVNVNTYLRSIDKIDDYKMVFVLVL